jgi:hypothetical protein
MLSTCPKTVATNVPANTRVLSSWIEIGEVIEKEFKKLQEFGSPGVSG